MVTGLKQGVQTAIDSSDPASFTSRQAYNEQPTLLLAAVGDCGETCDIGVDYIPDSVVLKFSSRQHPNGTEPLINALDLNSITGTTGQPLSLGQTRGVIRTFYYGGHGTYLFPYEVNDGRIRIARLLDSDELNCVGCHQYSAGRGCFNGCNRWKINRNSKRRSH